MINNFIEKPLNRSLELRTRRLFDLEKEGDKVLIAVKYELSSPEIAYDEKRIGIGVGFTRLPKGSSYSNSSNFVLDTNLGDKRHHWENSSLSFETKNFLDYCLLTEKKDQD